MRIGLMGLNMGPATDPLVARDLAQAAEELGYDSIWVGDHPALPSPPLPGSPFPPGYAFGAPLVALGFLAAATRHVLLGTGVLLVPQRNPVHLAKELATLDRLSAGRLVVGVGVGYLEAEFRVLGVGMGDRGRRTDEYLDAMRALWSVPSPRFEGSTVTIDGVEVLPAPLRAGGPPFLVGGHTEAAFDRAARLGAGWLGWSLRPDQAGRRAERLHARPRTEGQPPLEISVMPAGRLTPETVAEFGRSGVDRLVVSPTPDLDAARLLTFVERNAPAALGVTPATPTWRDPNAAG